MESYSTPATPVSAHWHATGSLACKHCRTYICALDWLVSTSYRGFAGRAVMSFKVRNVVFDRPSVQLMRTGAYTIQEMSCKNCTSYLGWRMIQAYEKDEKWKEGKFILELELLSKVFPSPARRMQPPAESDFSGRKLRHSSSRGTMVSGVRSFKLINFMFPPSVSASSVDLHTSWVEVR